MHKYYLFAETAFIHQGDLNYLKELVKKVAASQAQGIKFQVLTQPSDFVSTYHSAFDQLASYCFTMDEWKTIFHLAVESGLDIIMMPLHLEALALSMHFPVKYLEIHSVSYHDKALKMAVKETGHDVIITAGGRTTTEVEEDISFFQAQAKVLMVGFQAFPSKLEDIRIQQIAHFRKQYTGLQIGYADHSAFDSPYAIKSLEYAYLLGATVFEKHVALQAGEERVDYSAAVDTDALNEIANQLDFLTHHVYPSTALLTTMTPAEQHYRKRQLVCVAASDIAAGTTIESTDIQLKMYDGTGETFSDPAEIIGHKVTASVAKNQPFLINKR